MWGGRPSEALRRPVLFDRVVLRQGFAEQQRRHAQLASDIVKGAPPCQQLSAAPQQCERPNEA